MTDPARILCVAWSDGRAALLRVRAEVFVAEQGVSWPLELDGLDALSDTRHFLAIDAAGQALGCARLLAGGHIGRMAVLAGWRGRGIGRQLLMAVMKQAWDDGERDLVLHAQVDKIGFYARFGFTVAGSEFEDAGILHMTMTRPLTAPPE